MQFRIADTFTESLAKLNGEEQRAAKTTAFDLQLNPAQPGLQFHRVDRARDKNFWSVRVNKGVRMIVHKTAANLLLCYVGEHDDAYRWAERRLLEQHPHTGAAQLVEIREVVREIEIPRYVAAERAVFAGVPDSQLLNYGVPAEWLDDVKQVADEDALLALADHLPAEAAEALLELATGNSPERPVRGATDGDPFAHPDAQRRFRVMSNQEELRRALEYPWEKWTVFLHPAQRQVVERTYRGPARVSGSAGTGKTIVALHRAVHLARTHSDARVLLTTFSPALADALRARVVRLIAREPKIAERLEVHAMADIGRRLYQAHFGRPDLATPDRVRELLRQAAAEVEDLRFSLRFLWTEWSRVVDAWQLAKLGTVSGRAAARSEDSPARTAAGAPLVGLLQGGRRSGRARAPDRTAPVRSPGAPAREDGAPAVRVLRGGRGAGHRRGRVALSGRPRRRAPGRPVLRRRPRSKDLPDAVLLARLGGRHPRALAHLAGQLPHLPSDPAAGGPAAAARDLGRGRQHRPANRHRLRVQWRQPVIQVLPSHDAETAAIAEWLKARGQEGCAPHEMGVFVRSKAELDRATAAVAMAGYSAVDLAQHAGGVSGNVAVGTMHLAKGLEFRAVVVAACDDEVLPLQARIERVGDQAELDEVYTTERHLLYVACTRARDHLLVTGVEPASEFLDDLLSEH